jgi:hypothetical protein
MTVITPKNIGGKKHLDPYISVSTFGVFFTSATCDRYDLGVGNTIQFINEGMFWAFLKVIDNDAFRLVRPASSKNGLQIYNTGLANRILSSMGIDRNSISKPVRLNLKSSSVEFKGVETIEIIPTSRARKA